MTPHTLRALETISRHVTPDDVAEMLKHQNAARQLERAKEHGK